MTDKSRMPCPDNAGRKRGGNASNRSEIRTLQAELNQAQSMITQLREELEAVRVRCMEGDEAKDALAKLAEEVRRRELAREHELAIAREFQKRFLPHPLPRFDGVEFAVRYLPCARVGGDFYDVFDMGNDCVGVLIADIASHGLPATLATAVAKMGFDTFRQNEHSPKAIMEKTNTHVAKSTVGSQFITAFLAALDMETLKIKYVNAGHPSPLLQRGESFELLDTEGLCCGMFEEPNYEERETQLEPGDRLIFYTRGLVTASNADGKPYENTRLYEFVRARGEQPLDEVLEGIVGDFRAHVAGSEQTDDVILVGMDLRRVARREERVVIPSDPQQLRRVESAIIPRLEELNYGERAIFAVRLALEEAVVNAIKHGNKMDKAKKITVAYSIDAKECRIAVMDEGSGFDPSAVPDPTADENLELPHGRGLALIRAYMDEVTFTEKGNCIAMRKKAPWTT